MRNAKVGAVCLSYICNLNSYPADMLHLRVYGINFTFASFAGCLLIIIFLIRLLPVIPIWETKKGDENKPNLYEA